MTLEEILEDIADADLQGRAEAFADILTAMAARIPDRKPDSPDNYSQEYYGRIAFEAGQASDEAWEWLRSELRLLATKIRSSAELYI
jgi:hypothetical protein